MINHKHKLIFVHINKTGGSSIEHFFKTYPEKQHFLASEYKAEQKPKLFNNYYKFAFVRNPWDRLVSWFLWLRKDTFRYNWKSETPFANQMSLFEKKYRWGLHKGHPKVQEGWYLNLKDQFQLFVKSINITSNMSYGSPSGPEAYNAKGRWVSSQLKWITNSRGKLLVNFVGRFENLQKDFNKVCRKKKIEKGELAKAKTLFNRPHYSQFYNEATEKKVRKLYAEDIEYFGYEFERRKDVQHKL